MSSAIYAATQGGLSISIDGGASFSNRTTANGLGSNNANDVYAIGLNVYASTLGGVSISTNGGTSFLNKTTADGLGDNSVRGVYAIGSTIYAATIDGLSISIDGGASFINKTTADGLGSNVVIGVYAIGLNVYAATQGGLSISIDGGASFSNRTTADGLGNNIVRGVYAIGLNVYAATLGGVSISIDGGDSFDNKTTANGLGNNYVIGVYAIGLNVYAATQGGLSISIDGGDSFDNKTTANGLGSNVMIGVYAIGLNVYAATQGGLSISIDGGASFSNRTTANGLGNNIVRGVYAIETPTNNTNNTNICFHKGTQILTPEGYKAVESFKTGDLITTTKNIKASITIKDIVKFIGKKEDGALYCLPKDSLKKGKPLNDLYMSADHAYKHNGIWKHMKCASPSEFPHSRTKKYTRETDEEDIEYYHIVIDDYFAHTIIAEGVEVETCFKDNEDGVLMVWSCDEKACTPLKCEKKELKEKNEQKKALALNKRSIFSPFIKEQPPTPIVKPLLNIVKGEKKKKSMTMWAFNKELNKNMPLDCNEINLPN